MQYQPEKKDIVLIQEGQPFEAIYLLSSGTVDKLIDGQVAETLRSGEIYTLPCFSFNVRWRFFYWNIVHDRRRNKQSYLYDDFQLPVPNFTQEPVWQICKVVTYFNNAEVQLSVKFKNRARMR